MVFNDPIARARRALSVGAQVPTEIVLELIEEVEQRRRTVTTGGPPKPPDRDWANAALPPPPSASAPGAPPIRSNRGSDSKKGQI